MKKSKCEQTLYSLNMVQTNFDVYKFKWLHFSSVIPQLFTKTVAGWGFVTVWTSATQSYMAHLSFILYIILCTYQMYYLYITSPNYLLFLIDFLLLLILFCNVEGANTQAFHCTFYTCWKLCMWLIQFDFDLAHAQSGIRGLSEECPEGALPCGRDPHSPESLYYPVVEILTALNHYSIPVIFHTRGGEAEIGQV